MGVTITSDPFTSAVPEVPLKAAPLARVIAQVRFPLVASFARLEGISGFQDVIRGDYPILRHEKAHTFVVGQEGLEAKASDTTIWRFHDKADRWRVSLTTEFVAVETSNYTGRAELLDRLKSVLAALQPSGSIAVYDRLGVRYINRISGALLSEIGRLVRPEVLGIAGRKFDAQLVHTFTESSFILKQGRMTVRSGRIPAGATPDPTAIVPIDVESWLLDLDMFTVTFGEFELERIMKQAEEFSSTIYSFFRWSVEDEFLRRFGGDL